MMDYLLKKQILISKEKINTAAKSNKDEFNKIITEMKTEK
jgi:ribosomal protein L17